MSSFDRTEVARLSIGPRRGSKGARNRVSEQGLVRISRRRNIRQVELALVEPRSQHIAGGNIDPVASAVPTAARLTVYYEWILRASEFTVSVPIVKSFG